MVVGDWYDGIDVVVYFGVILVFGICFDVVIFYNNMFVMFNVFWVVVWFGICCIVYVLSEMVFGLLFDVFLFYVFVDEDYLVCLEFVYLFVKMFEE